MSKFNSNLLTKKILTIFAFAIIGFCILSLTACTPKSNEKTSENSEEIVSEITSQIDEQSSEIFEEIPEDPYTDIKVENDYVGNEEDAIRILKENVELKDDYTFSFISENENNIEKWYDFYVCYKDVPLYGYSYRVHSYEDFILIQASNIEKYANILKNENEIDYEAALLAYREAAQDTDTYTYTGKFYIRKDDGNDFVCAYLFENAMQEIYLSTINGELITSRSLVIVD